MIPSSTSTATTSGSTGSGGRVGVGRAHSPPRAGRAPSGSTTATDGGVRRAGRTQHDARAVPSRGRRCQPFDQSRRADSAPLPTTATTSRPKPSSLRHHASCATVGRPRERTLAGTPRGLRVLVRLGEQRPARRPRALSRRPRHCSSRRGRSRTRAEARPGRETRLADRLVVAACDHRRFGAVGRGDHDPRRVPRHVRRVPLVPGERRAVGRPGGVPREVGVRDDGRAADRRAAPSRSRHASSRLVDERDPARGSTPRAPRLGRVRAAASTSPVPPRAHDTELAVAADDHELVGVGPGVGAAPRACHAVRASDHDRWCRAVRGRRPRDRPTAVGADPGQTAGRREPSGARRRSASTEPQATGLYRGIRENHADSPPVYSWPVHDFSSTPSTHAAAPPKPLRIAWLDLPRQPALRRPGRLHPLSRRGAHRARATRSTVFAGPALARARRPVAAREGAEPRPLPVVAPVPGPVAARVPRHDRPARVRAHVRGRLPRAVHVQPAGPPAAPGPPRRLRPRSTTTSASAAAWSR